MNNVDIFLDYIKTFYQVTVIKGDTNMIMFHDCIEIKNTSQVHFVGKAFGFEIYLVWDKAQIYTNIDIYKKDNSESVVEFARKIKNIQTYSFLKYLSESLNKFDKQIQLLLRDVPEEFPNLFEEHEITDNPIYSEDIS
jgi:hypothetical protein